MLPNTNGSSTSPWMDSVSMPAFPPLAGDTSAEVCVIGAGIAGLTSAYLLAREGREPNSSRNFGVQACAKVDTRTPWK